MFAREPAVMNAVLGIVIRAIQGNVVARAGYIRMRAQTGAVTLIQRFGSALNLGRESLTFVQRYGPLHPAIVIQPPLTCQYH
jgi:hypothetical protein